MPPSQIENSPIAGTSKPVKRLGQIDILRGVAVILVLFRHHWAGIDILQKIGWIGVDLFFVLSGFLVSGLLFSEHKKFGQVRPFYFLIRRGFKIYPLFYTSMILTVLLVPDIPSRTLLPELLFLQNYLGAFWGHHWSLAVEEHFYFLIAFLALLVPSDKRIAVLAVVIFFGCLAFRFMGAGAGATHARIDALFMGVCISYFYHFHDLTAIHTKYKPILLVLCTVPFIFASMYSVYDTTMQTVGFTVLYIGFGALLIICLYRPEPKNILARVLATVGLYSYGIYLFHLYLIKFVVGDRYHLQQSYEFAWDVIPSFLIFFFGSITLGIAASYLIEKPFLYLRDKSFPRRGRTDKSIS